MKPKHSAALILCIFAAAVVAWLFSGCAMTTTTRPDGTVTTTRYTDPKAMRELSNAVGIIGAAAAQEAIRQMVEEQGAR